MRQHNLPERRVALHELVSLAYLIQREHVIDDRTHVAPFEQRQDITRERLGRVCFLARGARTHRGAANHETPRQNGAEVEIRGAAGEQPDQNDAAEVRGALQARRQLLI